MKMTQEVRERITEIKGLSREARERVEDSRKRGRGREKGGREGGGGVWGGGGSERGSEGASEPASERLSEALGGSPREGGRKR